MNKRIILIGLSLLFFIPAISEPVSAQIMDPGMMGGNYDATEEADPGHGETLEEVLDKILRAHEVQTIQELDCAQLNDHELEELGEAVMSRMHPDPGVHERMDAMMGGEGSESLRLAHIRMGRNYLGCIQGGRSMGMTGNYDGMMGMMRGGGEGRNMMNWGGYGMVGSPLFGGLSGVFWLATWVLVIVLLVVMIRYFWRKGAE